MLALLMMAAVMEASSLPAPQVLLTQRELDMISKRCATPRRWLRRQPDRITIAIGSKAPYGKVDCVLAELRRSNAAMVGFIGNDVVTK